MFRFPCVSDLIHACYTVHTTISGTLLVVPKFISILDDVLLYIALTIV